MAPKKLGKKLRKEEKVKKAIIAFTCLMTMSCHTTEQCWRKTETTLDQFVVPKRLRPSDAEAGPSGLQTLPRRERTPESQLLFLVGFLWEFRNAL